MNLRSANLDLIRATAVSMVVVTHVLEACRITGDQVIGMGQAGVLMFFVHTALVLMQSLERLEVESPDRLALRFYIRRFFRIYPLPVLVVFAFLAVAKLYPAAVTIWFVRYQPTIGQLLANLTLTQNLLKIQDIVLVMWSLPPEVQMYAALPIFFALRKSLPTSMLLFWSGWVIMLTFLTGITFDLLQYLPMFLPGIIAYQYSKTVMPKLPGWLWPAAMAFPMAAFVIFAHKSVVVSWFACLALGLLIPHFKPITSRQIATGAATIARYSYGIYLTHLGCIFVASKLLGHQHLSAKLFASAILISGSAVLLYHCIEKPFINLGATLARKMVVSSSIPKAVAASGAQ